MHNNSTRRKRLGKGKKEDNNGGRDEMGQRVKHKWIFRHKWIFSGCQRKQKIQQRIIAKDQ